MPPHPSQAGMRISPMDPRDLHQRLLADLQELARPRHVTWDRLGLMGAAPSWRDSLRSSARYRSTVSMPASARAST
jgi:hypothetical protein